MCCASTYEHFNIRVLVLSTCSWIGVSNTSNATGFRMLDFGGSLLKEFHSVGVGVQVYAAAKGDV